MFFGLIAQPDHPCCKMQELLESFFRSSIDNGNFSNDLFPKWIHGNLKEQGSVERKTLSFLFKEVHKQLHASGVSEEKRQSVYDIVVSSNCIKDLCDAIEPCYDDPICWDSPLGISISKLMDELYDRLDLKIFEIKGQTQNPTHDFYSSFIRRNKYVCPFCGIGRYKNKRGTRREDFDHYLCRSLYPLSSANIANLVPSCGTCNQDYKKDKDILGNGSAFYPYDEIPKIRVEVKCVRYPSTSDLDDSGEWEVDLLLVEENPDCLQKVLNWDRVYSVKQRLRDEVAEFYKTWMRPIATHEGDEVDLIEAERIRAAEAAIDRMEPGQILKEAFLSFMKESADRAFVRSFFMTPEKIAVSS